MYRILSPIYGHPEGEITDLTDRSEADIQYYVANGFIEAVEPPTVAEDATVELDTFAEPVMRAVDDATVEPPADNDNLPYFEDGVGWVKDNPGLSTE